MDFANAQGGVLGIGRNDCGEVATQDTTQISQKNTRDRILDYLRAEPELTRRELAVRVGVTPDGVKYHLRRLKAAGVLRRVGSDRAGHREVGG